MTGVPCGNVKKKVPVVAKIMALVIAMVMMLSMSMAVFADPTDPTATDGDTPTTYKITLTNEDQTDNHTYSAYKLLSGELDTGETSATKGQLQKLDWALTTAQANALITAVKADPTIGARFVDVPAVTDDPDNSAQSATKFAAALNGVENDSTIAKAFAAVVGDVINEEGIAATATSTTTAAAEATSAIYTIEGLEQGYYFVQDTGATIAEGDAKTRYILSVVGNTEIKAKSSTVTVENRLEKFEVRAQRNGA